MNRYHSCNLVSDTKNKPILETRMYELYFPYGHVEEYLVKTILDVFGKKLIVMDGKLASYIKLSHFALDPMYSSRRSMLN